MPGYLDELNKNQLEAVKYIGGPSLVIAGAGSGKTRVLVSKVTYLIEQGYKPWNILALTFTNKAAREMKERIALQVGEKQASAIWAGTFHSIFARILRMEADATDFTSSFTIYDAADQKSLLKNIIKDENLDDKIYKPSVVAAKISNAKNRLLLPDDYVHDRQMQMSDASEHMSEIGKIYNIYAQRCKQADVMDFDDLLLQTWLLFCDHPDICRKYAERFQFILVDEYQDTNYAQDRIVWELAHRRQHVCVVGDDAQSIYSFRGANIDNILRFQSQYDNTRLFKLEQNYRSTRMIVQAANSLISKNQHQIPKTVYSEKEEGEKIHLMKAFSDGDEAGIVTKEIMRLHRQQHLPYSAFAILYRTNAQSRIFEEAFRKRSLPYCIFGGLSFYQRKEVKDVIAYFRLAVNPNDEEAFKRVVNYPKRGIGATTVGRLIEAVDHSRTGIWNVAREPQKYGWKITKGTLAKLSQFTDLIRRFRVYASELTADKACLNIIKESGIADDIYKDTSPEGEARKENLDELVNAITAFVADRQEEGEEDLSLSAFLAEAALLSDLDTDQSNSDEKVTLMTVHSAKGLEFPVVFIVGMEEELFPGSRSATSSKGLEEERRLFYVALTRAEKACYLSYASNRYRYGSMVFCTPSRFLKDIDSACISSSDTSLTPGLRGEGRLPSSSSVRPFSSKQRSLRDDLEIPRLSPRPVESLTGRTPWEDSDDNCRFSQSITFRGKRISVGQGIVHERFGRGMIQEITGNGDSTKVKVSFENEGDKTLLLKYARFTLEGEK